LTARGKMSSAKRTEKPGKGGLVTKQIAGGEEEHGSKLAGGEKTD